MIAGKRYSTNPARAISTAETAMQEPTAHLPNEMAPVSLLNSRFAVRTSL